MPGASGVAGPGPDATGRFLLYTRRLPSQLLSATALSPVSTSSEPPPADGQASIATSSASSAPSASQEVELAGAKPSFLRRHGLKTLISIVIAVAFFVVLKRGGLPLLPKAEAFAQVHWGWYWLHVLLLVFVHLVRSMRWRHLLHPIAPDISNRKVLAASWVGFTAILLLPLRAGEIVRPYLIRDGKKVTLSAALGTMGAERVIDGLVVTLVLAFALGAVPRLDPLPQSVGDLKIPVAAIPAAGYIALFVFIGAFIAMAVFYFARDFARRLVGATIGRIHKPFSDRLTRIIEGIASGLHFLAGPRHAIPFMGETLAYWGLNATMMWVLGIACGLPMSFGIACAVMGVLAVGILVPAGPGLFGAFQAATYGALAMYFTPDRVIGAGGVYVFLLYSTQFVWSLIAAGIGFALDPSTLRGDRSGTLSQSSRVVT